MRGRDEDPSWTVPIALGAATVVLTLVTLIFDPLWAYYCSWAAGMMTAFSALRTSISQDARRRLDQQDEALLLEVRRARIGEGGEGDEPLLADEDVHRGKPGPGEGV